jgi:hypothetical protein
MIFFSKLEKMIPIGMKTDLHQVKINSKKVSKLKHLKKTVEILHFLR